MIRVEIWDFNFLNITSAVFVRHRNMLWPRALESSQISLVHNWILFLGAANITRMMIYIQDAARSTTSELAMFFIGICRCHKLEVSLATRKLWHPTRRDLIYGWPILSPQNDNTVLSLSLGMSWLGMCSRSTPERITSGWSISAFWNVHESWVRQNHRLTDQWISNLVVMQITWQLIKSIAGQDRCSHLWMKNSLSMFEQTWVSNISI